MPPAALADFMMASCIAPHLRKPSPNSRTNTKPPETWLDQLSYDICCRVAAYATDPRENLTLLALAEVSHFQRDAVISALDSKLELKVTVGEDIISRWHAVFKGNLDTVLFWSMDRGAAALSLLREPSLRAVTIRGGDDTFRALAMSSVRKLELDMSCEEAASSQLLLKMFSALRLKALKLRCSMYSNCPFVKIMECEVSCDELAQHLQELNCLEVNVENEKTEPLYKLLPRLPGLRELTLDRSILKSGIPDFIFPFLRQLESVRVHGPDDLFAKEKAFSTATRLGPCVKSLVTEQFLEKAEVSSISQLSQLETLRVGLMCGADQCLPEALSTLPKLTSLTLQWAFPDQEERGRRARVTPGSVLQAIRKMPLVAEVRLLGGRLSRSELTSILEVLGTRLQRFETCLDDQDEPQVDRIVSLLLTASKHNSELRSFDVEGTCMREHPPPPEERALQRIHMALMRLQQNAPRHYSWSIREYLSHLDGKRDPFLISLSCFDDSDD